jgi:hypothetical protein
MTFDEAARCGAEISKTLIAQAVPPRLQIAILAALACAILALPRWARKAALTAHTEGLAETVDQRAARYNSDPLSQHH